MNKNKKNRMNACENLYIDEWKFPKPQSQQTHQRCGGGFCVLATMGVNNEKICIILYSFVGGDDKMQNRIIVTPKIYKIMKKLT